MGKSSFDSKQAREADGTYLEYNVIQESTDEAFFHRNPNFLGLGQTIWADKFCDIWGIFDRFISTHFFGIGI